MTNRITSITRRAAVVESAALLGASCSDSSAPNDLMIESLARKPWSSPG